MAATVFVCIYAYFWERVNEHDTVEIWPFIYYLVSFQLFAAGLG